jgi:hypothetical protein
VDAISVPHSQEEEIEDTKGAIRNRKSKKTKPDNTMAKRKSTKEQTTIYKTYI